MKKITPAPKNSGSSQSMNQQTARSVVTRLQRNPTMAEPDVDLDELRAAIDELPAFNATKAVALHRRIVNGDYKIDSERLAEKLIALESSLDHD